MSSLGASDGVVGQVGRATGLVAPDMAGEVTLHVDGGCTAFDALPADGEEILVPGTRIVVSGYEPPSCVTVSRIQ